MRKSRVLVLASTLALFVVFKACARDGAARGGYGGLAFTRWKATGFFRTHFDGRRWWLVTPEGRPFLSIGVCAVRETGHMARGLGYRPYERNVKRRHGSVERWKEVTRDRLLSWGFNTVGGWGRSDMGLPWTKVMNFSGRHWLKGTLPDFFDESFVRNAEQVASKHARPDDKMLLGYFLDNEMQWQTDWRLGPPLFDLYMAMPADSPGKQAIVELLQGRYKSVEELGTVWAPAVKSWAGLRSVGRLTLRPAQEGRAKSDREAFVLTAARQYFRVTTKALRAADPNHLILGVRFVNWTTPEGAVKACGEFCDVVSLNFYEIGPLGRVPYLLRHASGVRIISSDNTFRRFCELTGRPLMITEFSFRAMDGDPPNTYPPPLIAQPTVPTQTDRGRKYEAVVGRWAATDYIVGYHWFCYMDEPKQGRTPDGENGNYGLVTIEDRPYEAFLKLVKPTNEMFVKTRVPPDP